LRPRLCPDRIGELIDLCYEIGNDQLNKEKAGLAVKWLKTGCQLLKEHSGQIEDAEDEEMKLNLMHTYGMVI
jgi:hypothetical protein